MLLRLETSRCLCMFFFLCICVFVYSFLFFYSSFYLTICKIHLGFIFCQAFFFVTVNNDGFGDWVLTYILVLSTKERVYFFFVRLNRITSFFFISPYLSSTTNLCDGI